MLNIDEIRALLPDLTNPDKGTDAALTLLEILQQENANTTSLNQTLEQTTRQLTEARDTNHKLFLKITTEDSKPNDEPAPPSEAEILAAFMAANAKK